MHTCEPLHPELHPCVSGLQPHVSSLQPSCVQPATCMCQPAAPMCQVHKAVVESDTGYGYDLVPINLQLDLSPARLEIDMAINEMVLTNEVKFVMQWQVRRQYARVG